MPLKTGGLELGDDSFLLGFDLFLDRLLYVLGSSLGKVGRVSMVFGCLEDHPI